MPVEYNDEWSFIDIVNNDFLWYSVVVYCPLNTATAA